MNNVDVSHADLRQLSNRANFIRNTLSSTLSILKENCAKTSKDTFNFPLLQFPLDTIVINPDMAIPIY